MEIVNEPTGFALSWLECAIKNHYDSNETSCVDGSMSIEEYIVKWCGEDLKKVVEVE